MIQEDIHKLSRRYVYTDLSRENNSEEQESNGVSYLSKRSVCMCVCVCVRERERERESLDGQGDCRQSYGYLIEIDVTNKKVLDSICSKIEAKFMYWKLQV